MENLDSTSSNLVTHKKKSKKRNKNNKIPTQNYANVSESVTCSKIKDGEKGRIPNDHECRDSEVIHNCDQNQDEINERFKERLHIKQNGIVLTNGDYNHKCCNLEDNNEYSKKDLHSVLIINNNDDKINENVEKLGNCKISCSNSIVSNGCANDSVLESSTNNITSSPTLILPQQLLNNSHNKELNDSTEQFNISPLNETANIIYKEYESELQMPEIIRLIQKDLSEPYSIYTYRYFIHNWPKLCFLAMDKEKCVGAIVCKLDMHRHSVKRGYIAMLAVDKDYRKLKIGTNLVQKAIQAMLNDNADEVVLETEITNIPALKLYENLGFVRDKRLFHYYLNGVDALRLKLWFR